ncbi:hypothetical protein Neosp_009920 [[Neocosmospora] mangrovei]
MKHYKALFQWLVFLGLVSAGCQSLEAKNDQQTLRQIQSSSAKRRPNVVVILTDDQDLHLNSLDYLPLIKKHLTDQGTFFKRHFCTTAICCPSRVSLWTGQAAHNTNITDILPPYGKLFNYHSVDNYDTPYPAGWTGSDFLLDPFTYAYLNPTFQRNKDPPVSYKGQYTTDILASKALGFLDEAVAAGKPFFLGISPIAPHSNIDPALISDPDRDRAGKDFKATAPIPAERHAHMFPDVVVPRTDNFNPDEPSGANWIREQPKQSEENVAYNDEYYRLRLRSLLAVDELVESVMAKLAAYGILSETYVFYTSDNGFHIGQHRLQPGKACGYEEDINVPLIVRGPGVAKGRVAGLVTTHQDLAPTIMSLAGAPARADFDGVVIPLTEIDLLSSPKERNEHVTVEYWGQGASEGDWGYYGRNQTFIFNNTYKALRVISDEYNLYYSVWCNNEHELYDMNEDPGQLNNLLHPDSPSGTLLGLPIGKVVSRLDTLLYVTKSCKGAVCARPWHALHPRGNVETLQHALSQRFDGFYESQQERVSFSRCEAGYLVDAEGPQFDQEGSVYWDKLAWSDWT